VPNVVYTCGAMRQGSRIVVPEFACRGQNRDDKELIARQRIELALGLCAEATMNGLIYLVGLVVVIMFILSFLGLR
jgi:hypothetical protein